MKSLLFHGEKLRALRESLNLTMADVEEMTGVKQATQSDVETGKNKNPRPATVDALCAALNKDPIYFYYDGDNLMELFPKEIPNEVRNFIFDTNNVSYLLLAVKIKNMGIAPEAAENLLVAFGKALSLQQHAP